MTDGRTDRPTNGGAHNIPHRFFKQAWDNKCEEIIFEEMEN